MKVDLTPLIHALIAIVVQCTVGVFFGNWWLGALVACTWWMAREHTQAEYRWISQYGGGKRANMPWWGGFDPKAWDMASALDAAVPAFACFVVHLLATR